MRRAFTLIELLAVVAIIAIMLGGALASFGPGRRAVRVKGATRDILAAIRRARSVALVTQKESVVTYSNTTVDDEPCASIKVVTASIFGGGSVKSATTLEGETVSLSDDAADEEDGGGETMEDILFSPVSDEVTRGICIKVVKEGENLEYDAGEERAKAKISVFSNVDYLIGKLNESRAKAAENAAKDDAKDDAGAGDTGAGAAAAGAGADDGPVSVVWEANGRTEPHTIWVYAAGSAPDSGQCIKIDRFGGAKVTSAGEDD